MAALATEFMAWLESVSPAEVEFHQAVGEVVRSIEPVLEKHREYLKAKILERLCEPERVIMFPVPWMDDRGECHVNRAIQVQMNSALGRYATGLRFHPSVNLGVLKFLAFEQVLKNSLTTLPLGGGYGGSDFDPKGRSDDEVMRFCHGFMMELHRHIGPDTDLLTGDIGVGAREIGYLFGAYKRLSNRFTGREITRGGRGMRSEAVGYGVAYFAGEMMAARNTDLRGKRCLVSGSSSLARHTAEKIIDLGGIVLTLSDSVGHIHDPDGIDKDKLALVMQLRGRCRGRIQEYTDTHPGASYIPFTHSMDYNPLWNHPADCAFPCATQKELNLSDAENLVANGTGLVVEGANLSVSPEAIAVFREHDIPFGCGRAANIGDAVMVGLDTAGQGSRGRWTRDEIDVRLRQIMKKIHRDCVEATEAYGVPGDYRAGADIAAFVRVAEAMVDQGLPG